MSTPVTKHDLAALSKAKQEAEFRLLNATVQYQMQKDKAGAPAPAVGAAGKAKATKAKTAKKREAPAAAPAEPTAEKKKKEKKAPKDKPAGWLCEGNILAATECPLAPADQIFVGQTNHAKKKHNLCKACKKAYKTAKAAGGVE